MEHIFGQLFRHNRWANLKIADACTSLSDGQLDATVQGTAASIRETLKHLAGAEERYVALLTSAPRPESRERGPWTGVTAIRDALARSGDELVAIAEREEPGRILRGT